MAVRTSRISRSSWVAMATPLVASRGSRYSRARGEERLIASLLLAAAMALEFNIDAFTAKGLEEAVERGACLRDAALLECRSEWSFVSTCQTDEPLRVRVHVAHGRDAIPLAVLRELVGGDEP